MPSAAAAIGAFNQRAKVRGWPFVCAPAQDFAHPELDAVCQLWRDKAQARAMPCRADLTARAMKPWMTHMTLLERVTESADHRRYRVRLHGTALARYGGDSSGKFLDERVHPDRLAGFVAVYDLLLAIRRPLRVVTHYQAPEIAYLIGESFLAPLELPGAAEPLILSVTYAEPRRELDDR